MLSTSAPAMCDPTTFGLESTTLNKNKLHELLKKDTIQVGTLELSDGDLVPVMKSGFKEGSVFIPYDDKLFVYIQYHTYKYPFLPVATVTQTKIWRDKAVIVKNTFSPDLFFNIMLPITGAVLSDKEQTSDGQEFWKRRCAEAVAQGYRVALVDFGARSFEEYKKGKALLTALEQSWGGGMKAQQYMQKRWLVWK